MNRSLGCAKRNAKGTSKSSTVSRRHNLSRGAVCTMRACSVHNACMHSAQNVRAACTVRACSVDCGCLECAQCVRAACTMRACSVHNVCVQFAQCKTQCQRHEQRFHSVKET